MQSIYPMVKELLPELIVISEMVRHHALRPILRGVPAHMSLPKTSGTNGSIVSRL